MSPDQWTTLWALERLSEDERREVLSHFCLGCFRVLIAGERCYCRRDD